MRVQGTLTTTSTASCVVATRREMVRSQSVPVTNREANL
ncbi:hypothetical protein ebrios_19A [Escherichia phage Ebrios]|uniref:Uncharacterized protein n=1 Tax=Escherichia phage Ebrios TaxID=2099356 RepID=A0A2S2HFF7_9CAUD|nr:hypothetical protein HOS96_gp20 [Escherichia phage Ebrios]AWL54347.1 hypothetical protein ebrios_19A [Escherichia phage Ebrios]